MRAIFAATALVLVVAPAVAWAAQYVDRVDSPVYEAAGTQAELTRKAVVCISQLSTPVNGTNPGIVSVDPEAGVVVANSALRQGGMFPVAVRSTLTFEAHDAKFRVTHTNIEARTEALPGAAWGRAFRDKSNSTSQFMGRFDDRLAECIKAPAGNW